jgi:YopJ protease family
MGCFPSKMTPARGSSDAPQPRHEEQPAALGSGPARADSLQSWSTGSASPLAPRNQGPGSQVLATRSERVRTLSESLSGRQADSTARLLLLAKEANSDVLWGSQPGADLSKLDKQCLADLVAVENARIPGLNLKVFASAHAFANDLAGKEEANFRAVFPIINHENVHDVKAGLHHVAVDVRKQSGQPATVLVLESTSKEHIGERYKDLANALESHGVSKARVAVLDTHAQASPADCIMFSLHFSMKCRKNAQTFDQLHATLSEGKSLVAGEHTPSDPSSAAGPSQTLLQSYPGRALLPADFYKHAHRASVIDSLRKPDSHDGPGQAFGAMRAQHGLAPENARVNSRANHPDRPETLSQRWAAHQVERNVLLRADPLQFADVKYSASIEAFRLQELERALQYRRDGTVTESKMSTVQGENTP